jgi:hypothetical protein
LAFIGRPYVGSKIRVFGLGLLLHVIVATQEVEIGRTEVLGQPRQKVSKTPISTHKSWVWWHTSVIPATGSTNKRIKVQAALE